MKNLIKIVKFLALTIFSMRVVAEEPVIGRLKYFDETMSLQEQVSIRIALDRFRGDCKFDLTNYMIEMTSVEQKSLQESKDGYKINIVFFDNKDLKNSRNSVYEVTMRLEPKNILLIHGGLNKSRILQKTKKLSSIRMSLQEFAATQVAYKKFQSNYSGDLSGYSVSLSRNKLRVDEVSIFFHDALAQGNTLGGSGKLATYGVSMSLLKDKLLLNSASFQR